MTMSNTIFDSSESINRYGNRFDDDEKDIPLHEFNFVSRRREIIITMANPVNVQVEPLRLSDLAEIQIDDDEKVGYPISYTEEPNERLTVQYVSEQLTLYDESCTIFTYHPEFPSSICYQSALLQESRSSQFRF